jgi:acyl-coenzyme A thioesterase PaaI-like protein
MADGGDETEVGGHGPILITEGEWAGWQAWVGGDPFEDHCGPYYFRQDADGGYRAAFRAERKHMNGGLFMHGGAMLTFADYCLFVIARDALKDDRAVTISLNGEFIGPAKIGDLVECTGEVVRAGGSLVFMRGLISTGGSPMMTFSGVVKKTGKRSG